MIIGIDATNIRSGGGLTHLREILKAANISSHGIEKVIVWSNDTTLESLPSRKWLIKETHSLLNKNFIFSFFFQFFFLSKIAKKKYKCDLLFVPGGSFLGSFPNVVSLSQNMLPFEKKERNRFPKWQSRLRFKLLYFTQKYTFKRSKAVIFLTNYAKEFISKRINLSTMTTIIPHGINLDFTSPPRPQLSISEYTSQNPFKLLYVSIITFYKHQWNVAEAVLKLRTEGYPIELELVGGIKPLCLKKLNDVLKKDTNNIINYKGKIAYDDLGVVYKNADGFIFASSCENMPIILVEAMTAGLPICSSDMGPMQEVLGDSAFYFDPLDVNKIYKAVKEMLDSKNIRMKNANKSYNKSINYTWQSCSDKTFEYLSQIAKQNL